MHFIIFQIVFKFNIFMKRVFTTINIVQNSFFSFYSSFLGFFGSSTASTSSPMGFSSISFVLETFFDSTSNRNKTATKAKAIKENRDILAYQLVL
ncbi:hypothetical protein T11_7469 [Trichinella zimbabwensis]|uniref:Uncharacterized protein n=1 Tax=Trichinella zimbabwensis TaxID=268475 RepID=A0A0V1I5Q2_9BILA|nr:hypothetical protein T11_7469 [Trichinella zimbabwensis]